MHSYSQDLRERVLRALDRGERPSEIALRGLVVTVVQEYSALVVAQEKYATAQQSSADALSFLRTTELLEKGREVAHADVVRARLQYQDREVAVRDAQYAMENARLQLAVLLFPNFNQDFQVVDNLASPTPLPRRQDAIALAEHNNPAHPRVNGGMCMRLLYPFRLNGRCDQKRKTPPKGSLLGHPED